MFEKLCEQLWMAVTIPGSPPVLLQTHQELNALRQRITGAED